VVDIVEPHQNRLLLGVVAVLCQHRVVHVDWLLALTPPDHNLNSASVLVENAYGTLQPACRNFGTGDEPVQHGDCALELGGHDSAYYFAIRPKAAGSNFAVV
jgi:hypothetical protein